MTVLMDVETVNSLPMGIAARLVVGVVVSFCLSHCAIKQTSSFPNQPGPGTITSVPMELRNGVPLIPCRINDDATLWMILDTGSQISIIESDTAKRCGVASNFQGHAVLSINGVAGTEPAALASLESFRLAGRTWPHLPCLVRSGHTRLSGGALMGSRRVSLNIASVSSLRAACSWIAFDYPRRRVEFGFQKPFRPPTNGTAGIPLRFRDGLPYVRLSASGVSWDALLDTGCTTELEVSATEAEHLSMKELQDYSEVIRAGIGIRPADSRFKVKQLAEINGLGSEIGMAHAVVVNDVPKIGSGLLRRFRVTVDFESSTLWLER